MKNHAWEVMRNYLLPSVLLLAPGFALGLHALPITIAVFILARCYLS